MDAEALLALHVHGGELRGGQPVAKSNEQAHGGNYSAIR